ncbi:MAG: ATP-binding cassette domain-containing protein [Luteitalea sp.]|nr:ATP-binding cassette domain-containing protein [Luteitalea sp.]
MEPARRTNVLTLSGIKKRFGPTVALDGVALELRPGRVHALIGENGAGKTTLMNIAVGALVPDAGTMSLQGDRYAPASPLDARRAGVALIHQELSLCSHLTVAENILMGQEPTRRGLLDWDQCRRRAADVLEQFHHAELRPDRRVGDLPIAARQVVEICRAIVSNASVVLMDEPTSSLPRADVDRLFAMVRRLRSHGVSSVYISHFLEELREVAEDFTVLRDGRSVLSGELASTTDAELIAAMVGRSVEDVFPRRDRAAPGDVLLEVEHVAAPPAVSDASFAVRRGEVLGIAGLVGAGRTEMLRVLVGLDRAAAGRVRVRGAEIRTGAARPWEVLARGIGFLSEDRTHEGLTLRLSVADNITCTRYGSCARYGWIARSEQARQAEQQMRALGVRARGPAQPVRTLSGGNQQKVALARLRHQSADIWLLDEPTKGIDIGSKVQIYEAIGEAASEGKGIVMVSSYLPELFGMCDRLAVMSRGRLSPVRPIAEWTPERVLEAAIGS